MHKCFTGNTSFKEEKLDHLSDDWKRISTDIQSFLGRIRRHHTTEELYQEKVTEYWDKLKTVFEEARDSDNYSGTVIDFKEIIISKSPKEELLSAVDSAWAKAFENDRVISKDNKENIVLVFIDESGKFRPNQRVFQLNDLKAKFSHQQEICEMFEKVHNKIMFNDKPHTWDKDPKIRRLKVYQELCNCQVIIKTHIAHEILKYDDLMMDVYFNMESSNGIRPTCYKCQVNKEHFMVSHRFKIEEGNMFPVTYESHSAMLDQFYTFKTPKPRSILNEKNIIYILFIQFPSYEVCDTGAQGSKNLHIKTEVSENPDTSQIKFTKPDAGASVDSCKKPNEFIVQTYVGKSKLGLLKGWRGNKDTSHLPKVFELLTKIKGRKEKHQMIIDNQSEECSQHQLVHCMLLYARVMGYKTALYIADKLCSKKELNQIAEDIEKRPENRQTKEAILEELETKYKSLDILKKHWINLCKSNDMMFGMNMV